MYILTTNKYLMDQITLRWCLLVFQLCSTKAYFFNSTGGTFPASLYQQATFSYQFDQSRDTVAFFATGSAGGKCNIMGYWHTSNINPNVITPSKATLTSDQRICLDQCSLANPCIGWTSGTPQRWDSINRKPIVDFGATDSLLSAADYLVFPDLQMYPAVAGAVVPIYNIPELKNVSSLFILTRNILAQIYLGNIRKWNDISIVSIQVPAVQSILSLCNQVINVVVRTDSSGTTDIFTTALSLFQASPNINPHPLNDFSFANIVGHGQTPSWCGPLTDEIQILTTASCYSNLSPSERLVSLVVVSLLYTVQYVEFECDSSADDVRIAFEQVFGSNRMKVYRTQTSSSSYSYTIGYWITGTIDAAPGLRPINVYEPFISTSNSVGARFSTLQEGGYLNLHYNTTYSLIPEKQSIFVNISANPIFTITNPNHPSTAPVSISDVNIDYSSSILSLVNSLSPGLLSSVVRVRHPGGYDEYQLLFNGTTDAKQLVVNTSGRVTDVFALTLQHGSNYPIFYDARNPQGFSNSGKYTCYRHDHNLTAWSYYTGSGTLGVVAEVTSLPYSIGYSVLTDAMQFKLPMASLINRAGNVIQANSTSVTYAVMEKGGSLDEHLNAVLSDGFAAKVWPITGYTYWILRTGTHLGTCGERKRAMQFLYWFYMSETVQLQAQSLGFSTLPSFIRDILLAKLKSTVKCSNGQYAFNYSTPAPLYMSELINSPVMTYLSAFTNVDSSVSWNVTHTDDSAVLWNQYLAQTSSVVGAATVFASGAQKQTMYSRGASVGVLTTAYAHVAVVTLYNLVSLASQSTALTITPDIIARIYLGMISYWNDSAIQAVNGAIRKRLPFQPIIVVYRPAASDVNQIFTRYLALQSTAFATAFAVSPDGARSFDPSRFIPPARLRRAVDNAHVDSTVTFTDGSFGYFAQVGPPNSPIANFALNSTSAAVINPSNPANLANCEADPVTWISLRSGSTFDLLTSRAPNCYPITATLDYSTLGSLSSPTCGQSLTEIDNLRVYFSSWLFNGTKLTAPLLALSMQGSPIAIRQQAYKSFCEISCNGRAVGYSYCGYRDCAWDEKSSGGDYRQVVSNCDANSGHRVVSYLLVSGDGCIRPTNDPYQSQVTINCNYLPSASPLGVVCYVLMVFGSALTIWISVRTVLKYSESIKKAKRSKSHPAFLYIFLFGAVLLHLVIIAYVGESTDANCLAQAWSYNLALTVMYGPLVMKLVTVELIVYGSRMKKVKITAVRAITEVFFLLAVDVILLGIWTATSLPGSHSVQNTYNGVKATVTDVLCKPFQESPFAIAMLAWKCVLLGFGMLKAVCTWHVPAAASESKQFAVALAIGLLTLGLSKLLYIDPASNVLLQCICNFLCSVLAVCLIMVPKLAEKIKERIKRVASNNGSGASQSDGATTVGSRGSLFRLYQAAELINGQRRTSTAIGHVRSSMGSISMRKFSFPKINSRDKQRSSQSNN